MGGSITLALALLLAPPEQGAKAAEVSKQHQTPAQQQTNRPASVTAQDVHAEGREGNRSREADSGGDHAQPWTRQDKIQLGIAVFTALYLGVTACILIEMRHANRRAQRVAARSLWLTRKSNQLTRESLKFTRESFEISHRPYLQVVSFEGAVSQRHDVPPLAKADDIAISVTFKNAGASHANHLMVWPFAVRQPAGQEFNPAVVAPLTPDHRTAMISVGAGETYTPALMQCLDYRGVTDDSATRLYCGCIVLYQDVLKSWHLYQFSYRYDNGAWTFYRDARTSGELTEPWIVGMLSRFLGADEIGRSDLPA